MTALTISITDIVASQLAEAANGRTETAGVLIVGESTTESERRLLGREFWPAGPEGYRHRGARRLDLRPSAYMPALARAAALGAAALFVHSHPLDQPRPSVLDDAVDEDLRSVFQIRTGSMLYGSLIVSPAQGGITFSGRLWEGERALGPVTLVRAVGVQWQFSSAVDAPLPLPPATSFDRAVRAFGGPIQTLLASINVGIVGAGGTGSAVAEQLMRLGVGRLTVVDDDVVTATNITRIYGSGHEDIGRPKVEVVEATARRIGLGTTVDAIVGRVSSRAIMDRLRGCDVVFACTDDHTGRLDAARLSTWCLIPVIDVGVRIDALGGELAGIWGRVTVQTPGSPCVVCWNVVDQARLHIEQLGEPERAALRAEGYVPELGEPDPAVVTYTTLVAGLAVNELILRITGAAPAGGQQIMLRAHEREIRTASRANNPAHWCSRPETLGAGVGDPYLGRAVWPP